MPNFEKDDDLNETINVDTSDLRYPIVNQNEIGNWIMFERKIYKKIDLFSDSTLEDAKNARKIVLPVPSDMRTNLNATYDSENMGIWGNFLKENGAKGVGAAIGLMEKMGDLNSIADNIGNMSVSDLSKNIMQKFGMDTIKDSMSTGLNIVKEAGMAKAFDTVLNSNIVRETGAFTGIARNPYKAVIYISPSFRSYNITFKFMAKNYQEAVTVRNIIKEFQLAQSPSFKKNSENNIYQYPDLLQISLTDDSFLFKFSPCVIEQCEVDYHGEGPPIYIGGPNGEQIPASIKLNIQLRETILLTKTDFDPSSV